MSDTFNKLRRHAATPLDLGVARFAADVIDLLQPMEKTMTRDQALPYVGYCLDDALSERKIEDMPTDPSLVRLVGWQCGFEPLFVAVWSYLAVRLDDEEAHEIAQDFLRERGWFSGEPKRADFIL